MKTSLPFGPRRAEVFRAAWASSAVPRTRPWLLVAFLGLGVACGKPPARAPEAAVPGQWYPFEGSWTGTGRRHVLHLGPDHQASVIDLSGSLLLTGQRGLGVGFRGETIGLSDNLIGFVGRSAWTDERGDQVFSDLKGQSVGSGNRIEGTITGGTGRYAGATGEYQFEWEFVISAEEGAVSGRAIGLKGRIRVGTPAAAPGEPRP